MDQLEERIRQIIPYVTPKQLTALVEIVHNTLEVTELIEEVEEIWE